MQFLTPYCKYRVVCYRFYLGLSFSCTLWVCLQILASLFSKVSQNFHRRISESTSMWILFLFYLAMEWVTPSWWQIRLLLLNIWYSLKKGYLVGVCLYGSLITQSPGNSIAFSFSNCSCSALFCPLLSNVLMIPRKRKPHSHYNWPFKYSSPNLDSFYCQRLVI